MSGPIQRQACHTLTQLLAHLNQVRHVSVACLAQCVIPFYSPTYSFSYSLARFPTCLPTSYHQGFTELGFDIGHSETPIIPVMIGDEDKAKAFSAIL